MVYPSAVSKYGAVQCRESNSQRVDNKSDVHTPPPDHES